MKRLNQLFLVLPLLVCITAYADQGTLISKLVVLNQNVTDVDSAAVTGLALTAVDTIHGTWYYTTDDINWTLVDKLADNNALLLAADSNTRIYFHPNTNFNGTINNAISFRAWDQSSGTAGSIIDVSNNGGSTAFSREIETASITISAVNDAPVLDTTVETTLDAMTEDTE
ncbi:MAG: hypothetical protein KAI17_06450 [Thiotrichaceae bacterium]|nr:hypothetical protein [Thiotrichaceae bacterium]